jgi:hypothetical protein
MFNTIVFKGVGYAQYATQLTAAIALTSATTSGNTLTQVIAGEVNNARPRVCMALLQATGQNIRWTDDGTTPTATVGMLLYAGGDPYPFTGDLAALKFIQVAATAVLNVSYYSAA